MTDLPSLTLKNNIWYKKKDVTKAWDYFVKAAKNDSEQFGCRNRFVDNCSN